MGIMLLEIKENPDPVLRQKNAKIKDVVAPEIQTLILNMTETMHAAKGVGLAASQVGVNLRLCLIEVEEKLYVFVNPQNHRQTGQ